MMEQKRSGIMTQVPNVLTVMRLLMVPVFYYVYYRPGLWLPGRQLALVVFVTASITDLLDGYIARKYNCISNFGRLADPVADKIMCLSALFCFWHSGQVRWWFVALVLFKDVVMVVGSYVMLKFHVVVYAKWYGKAATFFLMVAITMTFLDTYPWNIVVLYISLILTAYSLVHYTRLGLRQIKEMKDHPDHPRDLYAEED